MSEKTCRKSWSSPDLPVPTHTSPNVKPAPAVPEELVGHEERGTDRGGGGGEGTQPEETEVEAEVAREGREMSDCSATAQTEEKVCAIVCVMMSW